MSFICENWVRTALFTNDFLKKISASAIDEIFLRENETVHFENAHVMGVNIWQEMQ